MEKQVRRLSAVLIVSALLGAPGALASGSVVCGGVSNAGGHDYFTKLGWQAFHGVQGRKAEVWLDNHTKVTVHVIIRMSDGTVENDTVPPGSTSTFYVSNNADITQIECNYWSGSQAGANFGFSGTGNGNANIGGGNGNNLAGGNDPDPVIDIDDPADPIDPDDWGGITVDVNPSGTQTDLNDLRSLVLKTL